MLAGGRRGAEPRPEARAGTGRGLCSCSGGPNEGLELRMPRPSGRRGRGGAPLEAAASTPPAAPLPLLPPGRGPSSGTGGAKRPSGRSGRAAATSSASASRFRRRLRRVDAPSRREGRGGAQSGSAAELGLTRSGPAGARRGSLGLFPGLGFRAGGGACSSEVREPTPPRLEEALPEAAQARWLSAGKLARA